MNKYFCLNSIKRWNCSFMNLFKCAFLYLAPKTVCHYLVELRMFSNLNIFSMHLSMKHSSGVIVSILKAYKVVLTLINFRFLTPLKSSTISCNNVVRFFSFNHIAVSIFLPVLMRIFFIGGGFVF